VGRAFPGVFGVPPTAGSFVCLSAPLIRIPMMIHRGPPSHLDRLDNTPADKSRQSTKYRR